jgi:oligosaccharide repeat unit polymerase
MLPGKGPSKWIALLIWAFWAALAFGTGARSGFLFSVLPTIVLLFFRYMLIAADRLRRFSPRAIIYPAAFLFGALFVVQIQGTFRLFGAQGIKLSEISMFKSQGNDMFSEGLNAYAYWGTVYPFANDTFPGASFIRPIPDVAFRFAIGWIPRVLWHNKPGISAAAQVYNTMGSGASATNTESGYSGGGGTVCASIAGGAYLAYGFPGVIQMGLLFGWLCKLTEEMLWLNPRRPLALMFTLGLMVYLFGAFRDLSPHGLYPLLIGMTFLILVILFMRIFYAGQKAGPPGVSVEYLIPGGG